MFERPVQWLLDTLLPEICASCARPARHGLCPTCRETLARVERPCPRCALPGGPAHSHRCRPIDGIASLTAPFLYADAMAGFVHELKYARNRSLGRVLACAVIELCGPALPVPDVWLPVPLHRARLIERTFNQADPIAAALARFTGRPLAPGLAVRSVATGSQTRMSAAERRRNLNGAFRVRVPVAGRRIALVDDVVTTGATLGALARCLREAGAAHVDAVAIARTPRPAATQAPAGRHETGTATQPGCDRKPPDPHTAIAAAVQTGAGARKM